MPTENTQIPKHLGLILDGNRRWAKSHNLPACKGHLAGYNALKKVVFEAFAQNIEYVSIYAFSTENWNRGEGEIGKLMKLAMHSVKRDLHNFEEREIRVRILGIADNMDKDLVTEVKNAQAKTEKFTGRNLCVCFNYGGQREIADAAAKCVRDGLTADEINETAISDRLYQPDVPPVDIVVRSSGEQRISNFMLWRIAYSELMFIDKYWPDMKADDISDIIKEYSTRQRRHGK